MPEEKENNGKKSFTVDELLKRAQVPVATTPQSPSGAAQPEKAPSPAPDGAFMVSGRMYYRQTIPGTADTIVSTKPLNWETMTEQDFYDMPMQLQLEATPGRLPVNLTVKFKDPQYAGHWFNKKAGGGRRLGIASTLNFVPAKKEDLEWCASNLKDSDGAVEQDDVVLFKIHKAQLYKYFRQNLEQSRSKGSAKAYQGMASEGLNPANRTKDIYYLGPQATEEFTGVGPVADVGEGGKLLVHK